MTEMASRTGGKSVLKRVMQRLRERPDSEHEMMPNRLVFAAVVLIYLLIASRSGHGRSAEILEASEIGFAVYLAVCAGIFAHILKYPDTNIARRVFAMFSDFAMMSFVAAIAGPGAGFLYPFYLWTVFGNGFRFGVRYLYISMAIAIGAFACVLGYTGFWRDQLGLSIALTFTLLMLPLYAGVLIRKMTEARRQAEEANRAKSLFLASVSHELRTPLNAVIGLSDLLRDQPLQRQQQEMIGTIGTAGRSLLDFINQILDFSRLEAGRMPTNIVEVDLYSLLHETGAMLRYQAESKGIDLAIQITADTPQMVKADRRHLQEVLANLASNAVKFTAEGHVSIGVQALEHGDGRTRLRFEVSDTGIGIAPEAHGRIFESFTQADETILDSHGGTGLGLAICKQIVEIHGGQIGIDSEPGQGSTFWFELPLALSAAAAPERAEAPAVCLGDDELADRLSELGIETWHVPGLDEAGNALARLAEECQTPPVLFVDEKVCAGGLQEMAEGLAAMQAGKPLTVLVRDAGAPEGLLEKKLRTAFTAILARPLDEGRIGAAVAIATGGWRAASESASAIPAAGNVVPLSVLVAEDNKTNQMVIAKILERAGHTVTLVDNGEEAVDTLRTTGFDVVLMDINMPVMNGIEATKLYRFVSLGQERIPIIALTADATDETRARCLEAGMDECASKPIEARELLRLLGDVAGAKAQAQEDADLAAQDLAPHVVDLSDHPGFEEGILRVEALRDLEQLGDPDFVPELIRQFLGEARRLIEELDEARARRDVTAVRELLHALRSAAANVGAQRIYKTCLAWRRTTRDELDAEGEERVAYLREELERARVLLVSYLGEVEPPVRLAVPGA